MYRQQITSPRISLIRLLHEKSNYEFKGSITAIYISYAEYFKHNLILAKLAGSGQNFYPSIMVIAIT